MEGAHDTEIDVRLSAFAFLNDLSTRLGGLVTSMTWRVESTATLRSDPKGIRKQDSLRRTASGRHRRPRTSPYEDDGRHDGNYGTIGA